MSIDRGTLSSSGPPLGSPPGSPLGAPASRPAFRYVVATWAFVVLAVVVVSAAGRPAAQELTVWDGVYTEAQARRGEPVYDAECSECHGPGMEGIDMAPGLAGGDFVWNWDGLPLGDLFERIRISMPQADPTSVSRAEKADILAYMLEMSGFPAGGTELSTRARELNRVTFHALQP